MPLYLKPEQIHLAVDSVMQNFHGIKYPDFIINEIRLEQLEGFPGQITKVHVRHKRMEYDKMIEVSCVVYLDDTGNFIGYVEEHPAGEKHD